MFVRASKNCAPSPTSFSQAQREGSKNMAVAQEAMEAAAAEVATVNGQLDKESAARENLEGQIRELERKLIIEAQKSKLSSQWMTSRKQWQEETNTLLSSIQEECNTIFTQNMVRASTGHGGSSPRSVAIDDTTQSVIHLEDESKDYGGCEERFGATSSNSFFPISQRHHLASGDPILYANKLDVSHAVDETEALVRSIMGN
jgi:hypothetical protein